MNLKQYLVLIVTLALFFVSVYFSGDQKNVTADSQWWAAGLKSGIAVVVALLWWFTRHPKELLGIGWGTDKKAKVWFVNVTVMLFVVGVAMLLALSLMQGGLKRHVVLPYGFDVILPLVVHMVVITPLLEEMVFRGALQGGLEKGYPSLVAMWMVAVFFALLHIDKGAIAVPVLFGSLAMSFLRYKTGVLWPAVMLHMLGNGAILAATLYFAL